MKTPPTHGLLPGPVNQPLWKWTHFRLFLTSVLDYSNTQSDSDHGKKAVKTVKGFVGWRDGSADKGTSYPSLMIQVQLLKPTKKPDVMAYIYNPSNPMMRWGRNRRITQKLGSHLAHGHVSEPTVSSASLKWGQLAHSDISQPAVRSAAAEATTDVPLQWGIRWKMSSLSKPLTHVLTKTQ